ncbi:hypothetical protein C8D88_11569 [Lentzea atacamensis]|uniref:Uncharacterized protein n=1 Tax=Lentzea atacamensis TaxID=531938 RepID=A0A316I3Q8_9PSEU|nr:hypothetical protein [Lentzea atacamensis]PWK81953.1 hypothetical protein C8D88_11569 [Lentzea atacamensis]
MCSTTLITAAQVTKEFDEVYLPLARKAKNAEHRRWPHELMYQEVDPRVQNMLRIGGADQLAGAVRAKKAMACLLYASSVPLGTAEQHLMRHNLGNEAVGAIRAMASRTRGLTPAVMRVLAFLHPEIATGDLAERTMVRLELGIPAELVELGMVLGAELTRAQYLSLLQAGITSPDEVEASDATSLANCLTVSEARATQLQALLHERVRQSNESFAPLLPPPTE